MPILTRAGTTINYAVRGTGIPVLLLAPGGLQSSIAMWKGQPFDPWSKLPDDKFQIIAMDQRNAGSSHGPLGSGWDSMRDDQLAVLDEVGVDKCLLVGSCIGPSFMFSLMKHSPARFPAAVMMQPIGVAAHTTEPGRPWSGLNTDASSHWFGRWAQEMIASKRFEREPLARLEQQLYHECPGPDFVFSATREEAAAVSAKLLIFMGKDIYHPSNIARELARICPNAELVEKWRDADYSPEVDARIETFLLEEGLANSLYRFM